MKTFQALYRLYSKDVYRFALWLSGEVSEAEDITSKTFIRAWVRRQAVRTETMKAYLFTIAKNIHLERLRKSKPQVALIDNLSHPASGPEKVVESRFELLRIRKMLGDFPEIDRMAFILRVQMELPYAEIARVLEISLSSAKVKVFRVRKKLIAACLPRIIHESR